MPTHFSYHLYCLAKILKPPNKITRPERQSRFVMLMTAIKRWNELETSRFGADKDTIP